MKACHLISNMLIAAPLLVLSDGDYLDNIFHKRNRRRRHRGGTCIPPPLGTPCRSRKQCLCLDWICEGIDKNKVCVPERTNDQPSSPVFSPVLAPPPDTPALCPPPPSMSCGRDKDCNCSGWTCERIGTRKMCVEPTQSRIVANTTVYFCPNLSGMKSTLSAGALTLAVVQNEVKPRLCTLTKRNTVSGAVIPIARSYDGHIWEQAAGPYAAKTFAFEKITCKKDTTENITTCQMELLPLSSDENYVLSTYEHTITKRNEIARFLEQMTFGTTAESIAALEATDADFEQWLADQMSMPTTSHRAYWRKRSNPKWTMPREPGTPDHPCSPYSRWRKYAFTRKDRLNVYAGPSDYRSIQVTHLNDITRFLNPFEAEDASYDQSKAIFSESKTGYSGRGYIDFIGRGPTAYIQWVFESPVDDSYTLGIRYAFGTKKPQPVNIIVNGNTIAYSFQLPRTSDWNDWELHILENIALVSGRNTVRIECSPGTSGPNFDYIQIFSPTLLSIDGYARTIVPAMVLRGDKNADYVFNEKHHYEICSWPYAPQRGYPSGRLYLRNEKGVCKEVDQKIVGNPQINLTTYKDFVPFFFKFGDGETNSLLSSFENLDYNAVGLDQEFLLPGGLDRITHPLCDNIPTILGQSDAPVFAQLSDGTWLQWDSKLKLEQNTNGSPMLDGGGEKMILTGEKTLCMNAPRNFWNEDECVFSADKNVCSLSVSPPTTGILLDHDNVTRFFDLTKGSSDDATRYVYAIQGLDVEDSPCNLETSRWEFNADTNCKNPSNLPRDTVNTFTKLLLNSGNNPYVRDIQIGNDPCDTSGFKPAQIEVQINGDCFKHVHSAHLSVYDMTYWAYGNKHPGNRYAGENGHEHPIKKWAENRSDERPGWYLRYPASHPTDPSFSHQMSRWDAYNSKLAYVGRLGDSIQFRDLPNELKTYAIASYYGVLFETSGSGLLVCGSFDEVSSNPSLGSIFDLEAPGEDTTFETIFEGQKEVVWSTIALSADDQLCQRMAWALVQIFVVVAEDIRHDIDIMTEPFLGYYDIMVRNCFGNYRDILREISYNPLMAENLSYLDSRSHAYIYETKGQITYADENFAREIMQLFTTGLTMLNQDGTPQLDPEGKEVDVYSNEDIMSFARAWTGFRRHQQRGNIESKGEACSSCNRQDPMFIDENYRDRFPKSDLLGGYIGDRYPLCEDLPDKMFLRIGAKYRFLGSSPLPELMKDNEDFATDPTIKRMVLEPESALYKKLYNEGIYLNNVILSTNYDCYRNECKVDTVRVVAVGGLYYEYVRPACVQQAFYEGGKKVIKDKTRNKGNTCANPRLQYALEACCQKSVKGTKIIAIRNYIYDGERMTFDSAGGKCAAIGRELCDFKYIDLKTSPEFKTGYHWTTANCSIEAKINQKGNVAIVYNIENRKGAQALHISEESLNYFKVYWENDEYPSASNNCGGATRCVVLSEGGCQCKTALVEEVGFLSKPNSAKEILSKLVVGAVHPGAFDDGTFVKKKESDFVVYLVNGVYDGDTIFEVTDDMSRTFFMKNVHSRVNIVGGSFYFRNAPHFMSMLADASPHGIGETTRRDAEYETEAVLDHYFYHPNMAPFICTNFIKRFGISNPSPRYVEACSKAFHVGTYTVGSRSYGSGVYGDLSALIASIALDREARNSVLDADPTSGSLREPLLKVLGLMRALDFESDNKAYTTQLYNMNEKMGQMAYSFESVFSFFLPEYIPSSGPLGTALLTSPESGKLEMPLIVGMLNGIFSLVKYGLSDCFGGFGVDPGSGRCKDDGSFERSHGSLKFGPTSVFSRVSASSDDAEETVQSGNVHLTSSDLELGRDKSGQWVGMRFTNLRIPRAAKIMDSYIVFEVDKKKNETTSLTIYGQAADNPVSFSPVEHNISNRQFTSTTVSWSDIPPWEKRSDKHHTPNIASIVQELVNRDGWVSGNSIVVIISGTGKRVAESWDGEPDNAPLLVVTYADDCNTPMGTSTTEIIDNLATLLTAGRLSSETRDKIIQTVESTGADIQGGIRLAGQLIATTPEFHATSLFAPSDEKRQKQSFQFSSNNDYKALVYLYLGGGVDSFNMLAPHTCPSTTDPTTNTYERYLAIREQVALNSDITLEIDASISSQPCTSFGLHPNLPILRDLYNQGSAVFVANTGLISKPVNKTNYKDQRLTQLFAHNTMSEETKQMNSDDKISGSGVVGRLQDVLTKIGYSTGSFSISGDTIALRGKPGLSSPPSIISSSGLAAFNVEPSMLDMGDLIKDLNNVTRVDSGFMSETWASELSVAMDQHSTLSSALEHVSASTAFPDTELGRQLLTVSRLMKTHTQRGVSRDLFYVAIRGFDTHSNVGPKLVAKFSEVNSALAAFVNEMKLQGKWENTTLVQCSEFGRTLSPNSGDGTDHGYGQNIFAVGGSLNGGRILGKYPDDFSEDSPIGLSRGIMIPTTPLDAIWNGISQWCGVTNKSDLEEVLPMRNNFPADIIYNMSDLYKSLPMGVEWTLDRM